VAARSWSSVRRIVPVIGIPRQVRDAVMSVAYMSVRQLRSPGKRGITLVRRRDSSNVRSRRFVVRSRF